MTEEAEALYEALHKLEKKLRRLLYLHTSNDVKHEKLGLTRAQHINLL